MTHTPCRLLSVFALALSGPGCVGQIDGYDPTAGSADAGATGSPDGSILPGTPDAAVQPGTPDAYVPPAPPDATPALAYPSGPYGSNVGSTVANLSWTGYADSAADSDSDPFNESPRTIKLEEFFVGSDPGARIIVINASAGWCGSCQEEAPELQSLYQSYGSRGMRVVTALFEDTSGSPANTNFAQSWGNSFDLTFPVVADPSDSLGPYYTENAVPMNMFIDASTMKIIDVYHGFDNYYFRQVLDNYVD